MKIGAPHVVWLGIVCAYSVLGLVVLSPEAVYSGDIGVKFVQARSLAAHRFTSLDLLYPGEFLDPAREFFPIRAPFVIQIDGQTQAIFSPASAVLQAAAVSAAGLAGMIVISIAAAAVILWATARLAEPRLRVPVLVALGAGGPLWFYGISGWEHAPAVALSTAAFAVAVSSMRGAPVIAGLLLGAGATVRDEVLLLLPGLLAMLRYRQGGARALVIAAGSAALPLAGAAALEVGWFNRPAAAHLRHAVHLVQRAAHLTDSPNPEVPALAPMTLRERYEAVVEYWMLGYGEDVWIAVFAGALALAISVRWRFRTSVPILLWLVAVLALASRDLVELLRAPKWLAGLHRVSPYLVLALLPGPASGRRRSWWPAVAVFTTLTYLFVAFAGVDTSGGKSLGPRLLLPLFPLLTVGAIMRIDEYLTSTSRVERGVGVAGVTLGLMAITMHLGGTIPAYYDRNIEDMKTLQAVAERPDRIVVADDEFTAQLLFGLYFRKIVLLADVDRLGEELGTRLAAERIPSALLVTRWPETAVTLGPYRRERTERRGRMTIQYWRR